MKPTFLQYEKPLITAMVQANDPARIMELMDNAKRQGAEAFGMQFERLPAAYRTQNTYKTLFTHADGLPVYVTNYRMLQNEGKSDDTLGKELIELATCGATLCDVMADYYDPQPGELTMDETAVHKQMQLIDDLHQAGAEVLMSSHVHRFLSAEQAAELAAEHQKRGADIAKIVVRADTMAQQIENLRIIDLLKQTLSIPFLFLCGGECRLLRRIGGQLGCCMYLCVSEYDDCATPVQPLIEDVKTIRDLI